MAGGRPRTGGVYVRVERPPLLCDRERCPVPDDTVGTLVRCPAFHKWGQIAPDVRCYMCGYYMPTQFVPTPIEEDVDD